jgi:hypothetical protein
VTFNQVAASRVVAAVVITGNAVGLAGNIAAAAYGQRAARSLELASNFFAANNTREALQQIRLSNEQVQFAASVGAVQSFCEAAVLIFIILAFAFVAVACARRLSAQVLSVGSAAVAEAGTRLRRQIVRTAAFVFVAFLLRSLHSTTNAVAYASAPKHQTLFRFD